MAVNSGAGGNIDPSFIREAEELKRRRAAGGPLNPLRNGVRAGIEGAMLMPPGTLGILENATMPFVRGAEQGVQAATGLPVNTAGEAMRGMFAPPPSASAQAPAAAAAPGGGVRPMPVPPSIAQRQEAMRARQLAQGLRMQHRDALRSGVSYAELDSVRRRIDEAENAAMGLQLAPPMQSPQTPEQVAAGRARLNEQATELAKLPPDQAGPNPQVNIKFDPYNLAEAGARVERNQQVYAQNKAVGDEALASLRNRLGEQERLRKLPNQIAAAEGGAALSEAQARAAAAEEMARQMPGIVKNQYATQAQQAATQSKITGLEEQRRLAEASLQSPAPTFQRAMSLVDSIGQGAKDAQEITVLPTQANQDRFNSLTTSLQELETLWPNLDEFQQSQIREKILQNFGPSTNLEDRPFLEDIANFPAALAPSSDLFGNKNPVRAKLDSLKRAQQMFNRLRNGTFGVGTPTAASQPAAPRP